MIVQHYLLFGLLVVFALSASHVSNTQQLAVYIEEGDDIVLNCTFPGARSVKEVKWKFYKNETETIVLYQTRRRRDYKQRGNFHGNLNLGDGAMLLSAVQQADIGFYVGRILSKGQIYLCEVNLNFYTKFPQTQKILTVDEGDNVVLPCKWPGKPQELTKAEWTIKSIGDNTTEDDNVCERCGNFIGDFNRGDCSVLLSEVKPSDARCYIGKLYSKSHIHICEVTLQIVSGSKMQSNVFYVKEGEDVLLPCNLSENHQELSNIKWRFNDTIVLYHTAATTTKTTNQRGKFVGDLRKGIGTMLLQTVRAYEEGNYTADLHAGEFSDTCKLFLIVKKADGMHQTKSTSLPTSSILSGNIVNATTVQLSEDSDFLQPWKIYLCGVGLLLLVLLVTTMVLFVYHVRKQTLKKIKEDRRKDKKEDNSKAMYINTASRKDEDHCIYYN